MVRGQFPACPRCTSLDLRWISNTEGPVGWGAELELWVCRECGYNGRVIEFDSEEAWKAFRAAKAEEKEGSSAN